jgi:cytochrome P450
MNAKLRIMLGGSGYLDSLPQRGERVLNFGGRAEPKLLIWDPELVAAVFRAEREMRLEASGTLTPLVGTTSVLFENGPRHTALRQVVGAPLRGRALAEYHQAIRETIDRAVAQLDASSEVRLLAWSRALTLRIIGRIVLGRPDFRLLERFGDWVDSALGSAPATLMLRYLRPPAAVPSPWRTFLRERSALWQDIKTVIDKTGLDDSAHGCPAGDAQPLAVRLRSGEEPLGPLDDAELADQVFSLLFAGHETTASAIAWALYWLERDPRVSADIRDELATGADETRAAEVPLLNAACQEALRRSPPATVAGHRLVPEDRDLADGKLRAGTRLTPCIRLVHRDPDLYPDPDRYDPHRFLSRTRGPHEYLPFGGGTRRCLGAELAMLELRMTVAAVLRRYDLRCVNPEAGVPHSRGPAMGPRPELAVAAARRSR